MILPMAGMNGKAAYVRVLSGVDSYLSPLEDWPGPVSYTHLDVYKRQV